MGATSGYKVGIASPVALDVGLITAGSVNSWLAGNFNYDISSAYPDVSQGTLSADDATSLGKLAVAQDTAGFFNLPVCRVLDLRSFPSAAKGTGYADSMLGSSFLLFSFLLSSLPTLRRRHLTQSFSSSHPPSHPHHHHLLLVFRHTRNALRKLNCADALTIFQLSAAAPPPPQPAARRTAPTSSSTMSSPRKFSDTSSLRR